MITLPVLYINNPPPDTDIDALFPIEVTMSGDLLNSVESLETAFPIEVFMSGTMDAAQTMTSLLGALSLTGSGTLTYQATTARFVASIFASPITATLYTGAVGSLPVDIVITGSGRVGSTAFSENLELQFTLIGRGTGAMVAGRGALTIPFFISGTGRAASVSPVTGKGLAIGFSITGHAIGGARATGAVILELDITQGTAHLTPHGIGALTIGIGFAASATVFVFSSEDGAFIEDVTCLVLNVKNFALTEYDFTFNSLVSFNGHNLGAHGTALYELTGGSDAGANIPWYFKTGKIDLEKNNVNRLRHIWLSYRPSGDLSLIVEDGINEYEYPVVAYDTDDNTVKVKIGKGIKEKYVQFKLKNTDHRQSIFLDRMRLFAEPARKLR